MPKETPYTTLEDDWWCCLKIFSSAYSLCILNDYTFTLQQDPTCGFMSDLCAYKDHLSGYRNPRSPTHLGCSMNNPLTAIITILVYSNLPWCESAYHLPKLSLPGNKNFTPSWKAVNHGSSLTKQTGITVLYTAKGRRQDYNMKVLFIWVHIHQWVPLSWLLRIAALACPCQVVLCAC